MSASSIGRGTRSRYWPLFLLLVVALSVLTGAAGAVFKSQIVRALPAADEAAAPPNSVLHFVERGIDSWKPMQLALTIFRSSEGDRLYEALRDFQISGEDLGGQLAEFKETKKFQYPLASFLPLEMLEIVGVKTVKQLNIVNLLFYVANLFGILCLCKIVFKEYFTIVGSGNWWPSTSGTFLLMGIFFAAAITYYPNFTALTLGNIQVWINCLFTFACIAWLAERQLLAGVLIALAAAIKPQLGALLVWALVWRQWTFCKGFVFAAVPIGIASLVQFGLHNNFAYLDVLSAISRHGERIFANESVNGIFHRLIENGSSGALTQDKNTYAPYRPIVHAMTLFASAIFAFLAFVPALINRDERPKITDFVIASICFTVGSPIVWPMHYGVLLPAFVVALWAVLREPASPARMRLLAILSVSWLLCASYLPFFRLFYASPWNVIANPRFFGALMLLFVLFRAAHAWKGRSVRTAAMANPA